MIGNKDEAKRCFNLAKNYIKLGDYEQGKKLLVKAKRMLPELDIDKELESCEEQLKNNKNVESDKASNYYKYTESRNYTVRETQRGKNNDLIDNILKTNNYYDILGLNKNCTDEQIKNAYKKLAKLLHPDKNKAKGSEEAFKKVSKAFQQLINKEKRYQYDHQTEEGHHFFTTNFHDDEAFSPEEFFRNFFGVNFATCNTRSYRTNINTTYRNNNNNNNNNNSRTYSLFHILTCILMFLMFLFSNHFEQQKTVYSLQKTNSFDTPHYTTLNNIRFYTKKSFNYIYPRNSDSRFQVEFEVEYKYFENECNILSKKIKDEYKKNKSKYKNKSNYINFPESCNKLRTLKAQYNTYILNLKRR